MLKRSLLLSLLPAVLISLACHRTTEEDKVRKVISSVQQAAEEKKILSVLEHVSKSYRDPQGNDYDGIKGLLAFYLFQHQKVRVFIPSIDVIVTGPTAQATFQSILTGGESGEASTSSLPDALGAYRFEVHLRTEEGKWRVTSAKWERAGEGAGSP